jgi:hypothetical protein
MPQTTDTLRDLMDRWFGDVGTEFYALEFLKSHGYTEVGGMISRPTPAHNVSLDEYYCIRYLTEEWDFGVVPSGITEVN